MNVEGVFYVNQHLEKLMFDELRNACRPGMVGGFLPGVKQVNWNLQLKINALTTDFFKSVEQIVGKYCIEFQDKQSIARGNFKLTENRTDDALPANAPTPKCCGQTARC